MSREVRTMQYALLIYGNEDAMEGSSEADRQAVNEEWFAYTMWLREKGWMRAGEALDLSRTAKTVRASGVTDGPFAETKEALGGFYLLECDEAEALEAAARCPGTKMGAVEVRAVVDFSAEEG
jgi:hypothetical protein